MTDPTLPTVVTSRVGQAGHILLNRPRILNALDGVMIDLIADALAAWRDDPAVELVVIEGAGGRAFCAGGDIRAIRAASVEKRHDEIAAFFTAEYTLNRDIAEYPKPYVALIDGICMGGGIGVSVHGSTRVVTEHAMFAMPETGIGLFPDIGASYLLPRLKGQAGMYMALTGARMTGADAAFIGLATHFTTREVLATLPAALAENGIAALDGIATPYEAPIAAHMDAIDRCFAADNVLGIVERLSAEDTEWSRQTSIALRSMSPSSVSWTFDLIRAGATRTLRECLAVELALTAKVTAHPDFIEGVRAVLVDKDRQPKWSPATLESVDPAAIAAMFG
jgi:enoyl-CoA hydratase